MNRFFLSANQFSGDKVAFPPDLEHQIIHVLRLRDGDTLEVLNNQGMVFQVELQITPKESKVTGRIVHSESTTSDVGASVSLYFGLSNREKVEWILQKSTEVGVSKFCPFISSRTLVQTTDLTEKKKARWERIIREASEQSHRGDLPNLSLPVDLETAFSIAKETHELCLIAWEQADQANTNLRQMIAQFDGDSIALFIGPEGGFSTDEISQAKESGYQVVSLGEHILRMETAAIVFPALVLYELSAA